MSLRKIKIGFGSRIRLLIGAAIVIVTAASFLSARRAGEGAAAVDISCSSTTASGPWVSVGSEPFAIQANPSNIQSGRVAAIAVNPRDPSHWLVSAGNGGVWETRAGRWTRDGGATWMDIDPSQGLPARPINSLAFDPGNPNRLFAALSSYDEETPTKPGHIFRTENALAESPTWTRVGPPDAPFAKMPFNVIAIDPRDSRIVYAGSDNGLWESSDGGSSWVKVGRESGLPPASVYDIQINPATNRTMIFTYGRGAFGLAR